MTHQRRLMYLKIVEMALLNIRNAAGMDCSLIGEICRREADHVHNLPALISEYHLKDEKYYLDTERKVYRNCGHPSFIERFELLWKNLDEDFAAEPLVSTHPSK